MLPVFLSLCFVVLLVAEWRLRARAVRLATLGLALGVYWFATPCLYCALRAAMSTPPAARDTVWSPGGRRLPEYETGVKTMYREAVANQRHGQAARDIALGTVVWLALTPALRRRSGSAMAQGPGRDAGPAGPDAATPDTRSPAV